MKFDFSDAHLFSWQELYYAEMENEIGLSAFRILNKNQEQALIETETEFNERINADLEQLDLDDRGNYYSQMFEREELSIRELQRQQRYSLCLSLCSFFEGRLQSICVNIEKDFNFKVKIADLNGNDDLMGYWNYLEKVYEMPVDSLEPLFTPIKQIKKIRNIIAHYDGYATRAKKEKLEVFPGISYKEQEDYFKIEIDQTEFVNFTLDKMRIFLNSMLLEIDKRYKEIKG